MQGSDSGDESTENNKVQTYDDIDTLLDRIGNKDDWAARIATHGDKYTLNDGTSVWIGSFDDAGYDGDSVFVIIGKDARYGHYRLVDGGESRLRSALNESGIGRVT